MMDTGSIYVNILEYIEPNQDSTSALSPLPNFEIWSSNGRSSVAPFIMKVGRTKFIII